MSTDVSSNGTLNGAADSQATAQPPAQPQSDLNESTNKLYAGASLFGSTEPPSLHSPPLAAADSAAQPSSQPTDQAASSHASPLPSEEPQAQDLSQPPVDLSGASQVAGDSTEDSVVLNQQALPTDDEDDPTQSQGSADDDADEPSPDSIPERSDKPAEEDDAREPDDDAAEPAAAESSHAEEPAAEEPAKAVTVESVEEVAEEEAKGIPEADSEPHIQPPSEGQPEEEPAEEAEKDESPVVEEVQEDEDADKMETEEAPEDDSPEQQEEEAKEECVPETSPEEPKEEEMETEAPAELIPETDETGQSDADAAEPKDEESKEPTPDGLTVAEEEEAADAQDTPKLTPAKAKKMSRRESAKKAAAARVALQKARKEQADADGDQMEEDEKTEAKEAEEEAPKEADTPASGRRSTRLSKTPAKAEAKTPAKAEAKTSPAPTPRSSARKGRTAGKRKHSEEPGEEAEAAEEVEAAEEEEAAEEAEEPVAKAAVKTPNRRSSGRVRKPSSVAMEAAGEESSGSNRSTPVPKRPRRTKAPPASEPPRRQPARKAPTPSTPQPAPKVAKRSASERKAKPKADDPFDFDAQADVSPEPLKNISMAASSHGSATYTTAGPAPPKGQSRFAFTAAVTSRKSMDTTQPIEKTRVSSGASGTPRGWKKGTPPTSGSQGDVSSFGTKSSGGSGPKPRSTPSSKSRSSKSNHSSLSLFNDVIDDDDEDLDDDASDASATPRSKGRTPKASPKGSAKKSPKPSPASPAPKKVPQLTAEEQLEADQPAQAAVHLLAPGARCLAKWPGDKCFYPAWVLATTGIGAHRLKFWDGPIRQGPFPDIVPLGALLPGKALMKVIGDEIQPISIVATPAFDSAAEWKAGVFRVHNSVTEEEEDLHWEAMMIDREQTKDFVSTNVNLASQEVRAENISSSRKRQSRQAAQVAAEEAAPETPPPPSSSAKKKKKEGSISARRKSPARISQPDLDQTEEEKDTYFEGLSFVLTSANRRPKSDSSDAEERSGPAFNKKQVRQTIEELGGTVVEDLVAGAGPERCFLVADTHYRTHKYLSALARAVPAVSHAWVLDSVAAGRLLSHKDYALPAGLGLESGALVEWHDNCPALLQGWRVLVHTENRPSNPSALDFVQIWSPLVECMGGRLVEGVEELAGAEGQALLLTDASCGAEVLAAAAAASAPAVSSEWLIQAIITGQVPDHNRHPKYRYDFVETAAPAPPKAS